MANPDHVFFVGSRDDMRLGLEIFRCNIEWDGSRLDVDVVVVEGSTLVVYADRPPALYGRGSVEIPWRLIRGEDPEDPRPWVFVTSAPYKIDLYIQDGVTASEIESALERLTFTRYAGGFKPGRDPDAILAVLDGWAQAVLKRAEGGK